MTHIEQFQEARDRVQELIKKVQQSWVKNHDTPRYKVGDQVWLEGHHQPTNGKTRTKTPRPLSNRPGDVPCQLPPATPHTVEHP